MFWQSYVHHGSSLGVGCVGVKRLSTLSASLDISSLKFNVSIMPCLLTVFFFSHVIMQAEKDDECST